MKVLIFGAGAIGTYLGCSLHQAGISVVFLEKPEMAAELRGRGLRLRTPDQEIRIPHPEIAQSIDEAVQTSPYGFGIFALKSYDTRTALENISPVKEALPPILCFQNGVDNESILSTELGEQKVIAGTITSSIKRYSIGDVFLERKRGVGIAANHPLSKMIFETIKNADLNAHLYPRPEDMKWSKLLTNLLANATSAILDLPPAQIFADPGLYQLEIAQIKETLAVMHSQSIQVTNLPATPVKGLVFAMRRLPVWLSQPILRRSLGKGRGGKMPSLHMDLQSGRDNSEVEDLNGAVVRYGKLFGVPTPVNQILYEILLKLVKKVIPWETYKHRPDKLISELNRSIE